MDHLQWKIGDVTVTRVVESLAPVPPEGILPTSTSAEVEEHAEWLRPHFVDDDGNLVLSIHAFCIESPGHKIVVDTCVGNDRVIPGLEFMTLNTPFLDELTALGFGRNDVDTVICTHLHFDHVGWNTMLVDGEWVPTFPDARYVLCRQEWEHWDTDTTENYALTLDEAVRPIIDAGLADLVAPDHTITDELRFEHTPGHSPGHVAVHIESNGEHAIITGDLTHHPVQWARPEWCATPDTDLAQSEATRRRLLAEYADSETLILGTHYAPPCAGRLVSVDGGYRFEAVTGA